MIKPLIDLTGRRVLITGGGRGIGRSIALSMASAGADVAVGSRTLSELENVAAEVKALGRRAAAIPMDVMKRDQIIAGVKRVADELGSLDILVNNAGGIIDYGSPKLNPLNHDPENFEANLFFNFTQCFYATNTALPYMVRQKWGRIINIGSGYAKHGGGAVAYTAAKHGLVGYTRALAYAVAAHGINVNVLCPGWTQTKLLDFGGIAAVAGISVEQVKATIESQNVQKRIIQPDELGPMAALLASDAASAITGQVISVDGGFMV